MNGQEKCKMPRERYLHFSFRIARTQKTSSAQGGKRAKLRAVRRIVFAIGPLCALFLLGGCLKQSLPSPRIPVADTETVASVEASPEAPEAALEYGDAEAASSTGAQLATQTGSGFAERMIENEWLEIGDADAPLRLLVITNYSCEYCRQFMEDHAVRLLRDYVSSGTLRLQFAIFPLKKYPNSIIEAQALLCATRQGEGRLMNDALFAMTPAKRERAALLKNPPKGMDAAAFQTCMDDPQSAASAVQQSEELTRRNVTVVPTFFLQDQASIGLSVYPELRGWIDEALRQTKR